MIELIQSFDRMIAAPHLATSLVSVIIKSSLVLVLAGLIMTVLRGRGSVLRSYVLTMALIVTLALPLLAFVTPYWQLSGMSLFSSAINTTVPVVSSSPLLTVGLALENNWTFSPLAVFVAIWLTGTSVLLTRLLLGWFLMLRVLKRSRATDDHDVIELRDRISGKLRIRQPVRLAFSAEVPSPVAFGLRFPTVILPEYARTWPMRKLEMSLTHELAHIKRYDILWYLIGSVTTALYWFNPLVWFCRRKLVTETEIVCDDIVLMNGSDALTYAEELLDIARHVGHKRFAVPVGAGMTKRSELEGRLMSIMSDRIRIAGVRRSVFTLGIALTLALALPLSGAQLLAVESGNQTAPTDAYSAGKQSSDDAQKDKQPKPATSEKYPDPDDFVEITTPVVLLQTVRPEYPKEAEDKGIEGVVSIHALVDKEGSVVEAMVRKPSGNELLDKSALKAAYGCKYKPAVFESKPVAVWITYKVVFSIDEKK